MSHWSPYAKSFVAMGMFLISCGLHHERQSFRDASVDQDAGQDTSRSMHDVGNLDADSDVDATEGDSAADGPTIDGNSNSPCGAAGQACCWDHQCYNQSGPCEAGRCREANASCSVGYRRGAVETSGCVLSEHPLPLQAAAGGEQTTLPNIVGRIKLSRDGRVLVGIVLADERVSLVVGQRESPSEAFLFAPAIDCIGSSTAFGFAVSSTGDQIAVGTGCRAQISIFRRTSPRGPYEPLQTIPPSTFAASEQGVDLAFSAADTQLFVATWNRERRAGALIEVGAATYMLTRSTASETFGVVPAATIEAPTNNVVFGSAIAVDAQARYVAIADRGLRTASSAGSARSTARGGIHIYARTDSAGYQWLQTLYGRPGQAELGHPSLVLTDDGRILFAGGGYPTLRGVSFYRSERHFAAARDAVVEADPPGGWSDRFDLRGDGRELVAIMRRPGFNTRLLHFVAP